MNERERDMWFEVVKTRIRDGWGAASSADVADEVIRRMRAAPGRERNATVTLHLDKVKVGL